MKPRILSYGEIIFDLVGGRPFLGGAALNFAWVVNQLGGEATLISAVGNDDFGLEALSIIENYGINGHIIFQVTLLERPLWTQMGNLILLTQLPGTRLKFPT